MDPVEDYDDGLSEWTRSVADLPRWTKKENTQLRIAAQWWRAEVGGPFGESMADLVDSLQHRYASGFVVNLYDILSHMPPHTWKGPVPDLYRMKQLAHRGNRPLTQREVNEVQAMVEPTRWLWMRSY